MNRYIKRGTRDPILATKYNSEPLNNRGLPSMKSIQFPNDPYSRSGVARCEITPTAKR